MPEHGSAHAPTRRGAHAPPGAGPHAARPSPPFTQEHEAFRLEARAFIEGELRPHAEEWEAAQWFPNEVFGLIAGHGYLGLSFPREYGGGGDPLRAAVWAEELARCGSGGLAAGIGAHTSIALPPIWRFGSEELRQRWLVPGIRGEKIAALAITEPDAGSDVAGIRTHAREVEGGWVINGSKLFITGGVRADVLVCALRTKPEGGHHGISLMAVERGPGVQSRAIEKLGWHASDTAHITFDDVFVPEGNLLGRLHEGFVAIMANFAWERLLMALGAVGAMQACFEQTVAMATRAQAAEMALAIEGGRAMTNHALRRYLAGEAAVGEVTMAKLATQRAAVDLIDLCLQIRGLAGYYEDAWLQRALRDARLGPIGGGTDEIMKEILGRTLVV